MSVCMCIILHAGNQNEMKEGDTHLQDVIYTVIVSQQTAYNKIIK